VNARADAQDGVTRLALGWTAGGRFLQDSRVYSSGRMSEPHAVLKRQCAACHTYHDWSKRKEVKPEFTLPSLRTGGR
jgi:hypothetical protein